MCQRRDGRWLWGLWLCVGSARWAGGPAQNRRHAPPAPPLPPGTSSLSSRPFHRLLSFAAPPPPLPIGCAGLPLGHSAHLRRRPKHRVEDAARPPCRQGDRQRQAGASGPPPFRCVSPPVGAYAPSPSPNAESRSSWRSRAARSFTLSMTRRARWRRSTRRTRGTTSRASRSALCRPGGRCVSLARNPRPPLPFSLASRGGSGFFLDRPLTACAQ